MGLPFFQDKWPYMCTQINNYLKNRQKKFCEVMQSFTLYILRLPNKSLILKWPLILNFFFKISFSISIYPENIHKLFILWFFNQVVFSRNLKIQLLPTFCRVSSAKSSASSTMALP